MHARLAQEWVVGVDALRRPITLAMQLISKSPEKFEITVRHRYVFDGMDVGDSLFFDDFKLAENARVAAIQFAKRRNPDWKFGIRKMDNGWRIFRMV